MLHTIGVELGLAFQAFRSMATPGILESIWCKTSFMANA